MRQDLEFGLDVGVYGRLALPAEVMKLARLAEDEGFHSVWLADHVVFPTEVASQYPYSPDGKFPVALDEHLLEPIATMGVLVGATQTVKIGTAVRHWINSQTGASYSAPVSAGWRKNF